MSTGLAVHSRLSATKDSIVYAGVQGDQLEVVALDPQLGTARWHRPTDVSDRIQGVELGIYTDDTTAYFLTRGGSTGPSSVSYRPVQSGSSADALSFTAVTTATGKERWSTPLPSEANPDAQRCGSFVCLFVYVENGQELWSFDPATGKVSDKADVALPGGPGDDAIIASAAHDDVSTFISASRGPVVVGQFSSRGTSLDWSKRVDQLFPGIDVSPDGGWAGWASADSGWVIWLGSPTDSRAKPKTGDTAPLGAVAGAAKDGTARWLRTDRHPCAFAFAEVPVLCDGNATMTSSSSGTSTPALMEGVDPVTGAATWSLRLGGAVDEFNPTATVLRVDDTTYLIAAPAGMTRVDLVTGPTPSTDDIVGWCQPDQSAQDSIDVLGQTEQYIRSGGSFPCHLGGTQVQEPQKLPIPEFAGVNTAGYSGWVVDGAVHAERNP